MSGTDHFASRVFVVDEIDARPGEARAVRAAYLADYAPGARGRGMDLVHEWVSPPFPLDDVAARLTFIWGLDGVEGWWRMRLAAAWDPSVKPFWDGLAPRIESRTRRFHRTGALHV